MEHYILQVPRRILCFTFMKHRNFLKHVLLHASSNIGPPNAFFSCSIVLALMLVCSGNHKKYYRLGSLNNRHLFSYFWRLKSPGSACQQGRFHSEISSLGLEVSTILMCASVTFLCVHMERTRGIFSFSYKDTNPTMRTLPS